MSTPVNKGEGGGQNAQNPVNVVYEQPLIVYSDTHVQKIVENKCEKVVFGFLTV